MFEDEYEKEDWYQKSEERFIWRVILFFVAFIVTIFVSVYWFTARAEEHIHGVTVPDWYDLDCCNTQDCRPVKDEDVGFETRFNQPFATYNDKGNILLYDKSRWRNSKDERYHACFRGQTAYCIYIPVGA